MSDTRFGQSLTRGFTIAIVLALVVDKRDLVDAQGQPAATT